MLETIPCATCKKHFSEYLIKNPPSEWRDMVDDEGRHLGLFYYTIDFHNAVNERLKKPILTRNEAYKMYSGQIAPCKEDCADEEPKPKSFKITGRN